MAHYFYDTIYLLRSAEEIILYNRLVDIKREENEVVVEFLRSEYENEILNFPFSPPEFNGAAALWGAKTVYTAAQILLYREHSEVDLMDLFPEFSEQITPGAVLSLTYVCVFCHKFSRTRKILIRVINSYLFWKKY
jgi:hypothetical protein